MMGLGSKETVGRISILSVAGACRLKQNEVVGNFVV